MISRPLTIEFTLLGYLRAGPLHGYQLYQCLQEPGGLGQVWRIKQAHLYALLGKLEEAGFIQGALQVQETRPVRRVYQLTLEGQETYNKWVITPVNTPRQIRQEFLAKLYFAQREGEKTILTLVDNQLTVCLHWLERHHEQLITAPGETFKQVVWRYRLGQIQATLAWLQQLKSDASKLTHTP
jgi:DNA-binding PadR family transcriptional regulator